MSDEYTPTTEDVRYGYQEQWATTAARAEAAEQFDRWLAAHDAEQVRELQAEVSDYRASICFETTCINCARMLSQMAHMEAENERLRETCVAYSKRDIAVTAERDEAREQVRQWDEVIEWVRELCAALEGDGR